MVSVKKSPTKQIQEIDWDHPIYGKSTVCPEQKTKSVPSWWFQRVFGSWREVTSKRVYDFSSLPGAPTRGGAAVFNHLAIFGMLRGNGPTMGTFFLPKGWFKWWCFLKSKMQKSDNEIEYIYIYIYMRKYIYTYTWAIIIHQPLAIKRHLATWVSPLHP